MGLDPEEIEKLEKYPKDCLSFAPSQNLCEGCGAEISRSYKLCYECKNETR